LPANFLAAQPNNWNEIEHELVRILNPFRRVHLPEPFKAFLFCLEAFHFCSPLDIELELEWFDAFYGVIAIYPGYHFSGKVQEASWQAYAFRTDSENKLWISSFDCQSHWAFMRVVK
jgi:hypothetical protein